TVEVLDILAEPVAFPARLPRHLPHPRLMLLARLQDIVQEKPCRLRGKRKSVAQKADSSRRRKLAQSASDLFPDEKHFGGHDDWVLSERAVVVVVVMVVVVVVVLYEPRLARTLDEATGDL